MCLFIDLEKTKKHSNYKENKKHIFYKAFYINYTGLYTAYQNYPITPTTDHTKAKGSFNIVRKYRIDRGVIHAYTKKRINEKHFICVPIIVESNDIIAYGIENEVCFFKYRFSKETVKILKERLNDFR